MHELMSPSLGRDERGICDDFEDEPFHDGEDAEMCGGRGGAGREGGGEGGGESGACGDDEKPGLCAGCRYTITDRYYLVAVDKPWHVTCLVCVVCKQPLDTQTTCFARDGHIYCKDDYYRQFAVKRCSQCSGCISADELVMRVRDYVYHIHCFTCVACGKQLSTGEHFGLNDQLIFCQRHYESLLQGEFMYRQSASSTSCNQTNPSGNDPSLRPPSTPSLTYLQSPVVGHVGQLQKGRPRKRKNNLSDSEHFIPVLDEMTHLSHDDMSMLTHPRQKRMRTSFKHHQLRIMKSYFALNHNPDAKDLKQLAQKTGLSKRVLQVWFQNARAKHRRSVLKETDKLQSRSNNNNNNNNNTNNNSSVVSTTGEVDRLSGEGTNNSSMQGGGATSMTHINNSMSCMSEVSNGSQSPPLSDISTTPSLSALDGSGRVRHLAFGRHGLGHEHSLSGSGLADIFTSTLHAIH